MNKELYLSRVYIGDFKRGFFVSILHENLLYFVECNNMNMPIGFVYSKEDINFDNYTDTMIKVNEWLYNNVSQFPVVANGFVSYWIKRMNESVDVENIFISYLDKTLKEYKELHKKEPDTWKRNLEKEFYSNIECDELKRIEQSWAVFQYLTKKDGDYLRQISLQFIEYCKLLQTKQRVNQQAGNGEAKQIEHQESPLILPDGLHTDEAVKVFEAAIKAGYITKQGNYYKWNKSNALLAYMCGRLYCGDSIKTSTITKDLEYKKGGYKDFPEVAICTMFNVKNLGQSRRQMERPPKGYTGIDRLF